MVFYITGLGVYLSVKLIVLIVINWGGSAIVVFIFFVVFFFLVSRRTGLILFYRLVFVLRRPAIRRWKFALPPDSSP